MQGFTNFERREYCYEEGCARGAFVKVLTLATKRLNARRREIDRRAFFVSTQFYAGFLHFSRFAGPNRRALCLQRDFRLSNETFKVTSVRAKNRSRTL
jgi:hypothetical protein